jgi:hypothetical protein
MVTSVIISCIDNAYLYRFVKQAKTIKMVIRRAAKARAATKAKHNKAAIMAKIEANIRRKAKTYQAKQKKGMRRKI